MNEGVTFWFFLAVHCILPVFLKISKPKCKHMTYLRSPAPREGIGNDITVHSHIFVGQIVLVCSEFDAVNLYIICVVLKCEDGPSSSPNVQCILHG